MKTRCLLVLLAIAATALTAMATRPLTASAQQPFTTNSDIALCITNTQLDTSGLYICTQENNGSTTKPTFADNSSNGLLDAGDNPEVAGSLWVDVAPPLRSARKARSPCLTRPTLGGITTACSPHPAAPFTTATG